MKLRPELSWELDCWEEFDWAVFVGWESLGAESEGSDLGWAEFERGLEDLERYTDEGWMVTCISFERTILVRDLKWGWKNN